MKRRFGILFTTFIVGCCYLSAQNGSTPAPGHNPAATSSARVSDPDNPLDGNASLGLTYQNSLCGLNYTTASNVLAKRVSSPPPGVNQPATFAIAGIPAAAVIQKAYIWCESSGNGIAITLSITNPAASNFSVGMTQIGTDVDKCWGYQGTYTYRADVTATISGNGNYVISGFPTNPPTSGNDVDGATLMVIWNDPTANWQGDIVIWDGCAVGLGTVMTQNLTGFQACNGTISNSRAFMAIGDLQGLSTPLTLNNNAPITLANEDWYNFVDNATTVNPGQSSTTFQVSASSDCFNFCVAGLYWRSTCTTCCVNPYTLNMAMVQSNCATNNGSATATPTGGTGPYTYSWSPSGQTTQTATNLSPGNYVCTVNDATGCSSVDSIIVTATGNLTLNASQTNVTCHGGNNGSATVTIGGGTPPYTYSWTPNVSATNTANNLTAGTYTVDVNDNFGCTNSFTFTITEPPLVPITATANGPAPICIGASANLTSNANGGAPPYSYNWLGGLGNTSGITVTPTVTTTYSVVISDVCGTPPDTATVTVVVNPLPTISFTGDLLSGCAPICVNFTSTSNPASATCSWAFDNTTANGCTATHCFTNPGAYDVTLNVTDINGCSNTTTTPNYINVYPNPVAGFTITTPQPATLIDATVGINDVSTGGDTTFWNLGDSTILVVPGGGDIMHDYEDTGSYYIMQIVVNQWGCADTATGVVEIIPYTTIYVPNTFTPNGDGKNDIFYAYGEYVDHFKMMIFDRWGNLLFQSTDMNKGWDGRVQGHPDICQIDTYVWVITYAEEYNGHMHKLIGHVNLVR